MSARRWCVRRVAVGFVVCALVVAASASPAAAHGIGGREPTNVRNEVLGLDPPTPGVEVRVVSFGEDLELRNRSRATVAVLDDRGAPVLEVAPGGVRRWHDHRAHWTGDSAPQAAVAWEVPIVVGDIPVRVQGQIVPLSAPAWWPWPLIAALLAIGVTVAARSRWRPTIAAVLAALVVGEAVHAAGAWREVAPALGERLAAQSVSALAVVAAGAALVRTWRGSPYAAAPWVLLAGLVMAVAGASDVLAWTRAEIPSSLPPGTVRALVAVTLGAGAGAVAAAVPRLRLDGSRREADRNRPNVGATG